MMITRIFNDTENYEVGKGGIKSIELTDHGSDKTTIYLVTYDDEEILYVGLLDHDVEQEQLEAQTTIFEYL